MILQLRYHGHDTMVIMRRPQCDGLNAPVTIRRSRSIGYDTTVTIRQSLIPQLAVCSLFPRPSIFIFPAMWFSLKFCALPLGHQDSSRIYKSFQACRRQLSHQHSTRRIWILLVASRLELFIRWYQNNCAFLSALTTCCA